MAKSEKKVVRIIIVILISFMLFILYMSRPIFGIPIFDFEKYKYEYVLGSSEGELYIKYEKKTKYISISIENGENQDIYILRGEVYENNVLKEKFSVNKNIQVQVTDMKKIHFFPILCFILIGNHKHIKHTKGIEKLLGFKST